MAAVRQVTKAVAAVGIMSLGLVSATQLTYLPLPSPPSNERAHVAETTVVGCYDGDTCTFDVMLGLGVMVRRRVRVCDIDTPEIRGPRKQDALAARHWTINTLFSADKIELVFPLKKNPTDRANKEMYTFNRVLAWVLVDGRSLGEMAVTAGVATRAEKRCAR